MTDGKAPYLLNLNPLSIPHEQMLSNIGALRTRMRSPGILYYNDNKEPENCIGKYINLLHLLCQSLGSDISGFTASSQHGVLRLYGSVEGDYQGLFLLIIRSGP